MKIVVGNQIRAHFHPPGRMMSFVEGIVSRVDAAGDEQTLIVVDVTREVILDRERSVRRGYQEYILYEHWNDFPGQIEILPLLEQEVETECTPDPTPEDALGETAFSTSQNAPEVAQEELRHKAEVTSTAIQVQAEDQPAAKRGNLIAALFRRQR
jgi:hypothetical protein